MRTLVYWNKVITKVMLKSRLRIQIYSAVFEHQSAFSASYSTKISGTRTKTIS